MGVWEWESDYRCETLEFPLEFEPLIQQDNELSKRMFHVTLVTGQHPVTWASTSP